MVQMSSNHDFAFSLPTPTEPLRLHKHSHKVDIEEGSQRESKCVIIQDAFDSNSARDSSGRNRYMEDSQIHHEPRPTSLSEMETSISSISSGWQSSYDFETRGSSNLPSGSIATNSPSQNPSQKVYYLPDSPGGVMGNFVPMDSANTARPQAIIRDGGYHDA